MAPSQNIPPLKKNKTPELNTVCVMASKGLGRVLSFNVNFFLLLGIAAALILYLIFSFMLLAWYVNLSHQENLLEKLEKDFQQTQKALYQAKQRLKFLENYIDPSRIPADPPKAKTQPQSSSGQTGTSAAGTPDIQTASGVQNTDVSIKELKTDFRDTTLSVSFKLARAKYGHTPVRGYIFIIAMDRSSDPPRFWTSPKATLENGFPMDPKRGQSYKIRNFRRIRTRWSFESRERMPTALRILVYDRSGGLLLKEDYDLEKGS